MGRQPLHRAESPGTGTHQGRGRDHPCRERARYRRVVGMAHVKVVRGHAVADVRFHGANCTTRVNQARGHLRVVRCSEIRIYVKSDAQGVRYETEGQGHLTTEKQLGFSASQTQKSYLERETEIEPVTLSLGKLGFLPDRLPE